MTEWKLLPEFEKYYNVSNDGRIISLRTNEEISQRTSPEGYKIIMIKDKTLKRSNQFVHRLVAKTFIENTNEKAIMVDHINGLKADNRVENLRWVTRSQNGKNAFKTNKN